MNKKFMKRYSIFLIIFMLLVPTLSSTLVLSRRWSTYSKVYNDLPNKEYTSSNSSYFNQIRSKDDSFIWFANDNSFLLDPYSNIYLHNNLTTYFDPYSLYWLIKYKKWCKENLSHLKK